MFKSNFKNTPVINWYWISRNPNAIHLLEKNPDKINWNLLSGNPNAIHLLEKNPDKINWNWLSYNPNALHLLLDYDYDQMKENMKILFREITEFVFRPDRLVYISNEYGLDVDDYLNII